jgi:hypothetical protein
MHSLAASNRESMGAYSKDEACVTIGYDRIDDWLGSFSVTANPPEGQLGIAAIVQYLEASIAFDISHSL